MPPIVTRTLNPLPFRDLEPHRFEDMVRQLAYDFRPWSRLEAIGRAGSDDGFDARGYEATLPAVLSDDEGESQETTGIAEPVGERVWIIQCKRERAIGPGKLRAHLERIAPFERGAVYGLLLAACCTFSRKSREVVRAWAARRGISQYVIWGEGELEDLLFQPANDHLLFAYFNISLQIRRRSTTTQLRGQLSIKRSLSKLISERQHRVVLFRDPIDDRFPDADLRSFPSCRWRVRRVRDFDFYGLTFESKRCLALYDQATGAWDVANRMNQSLPRFSENRWSEYEEDRVDDGNDQGWDSWRSHDPCMQARFSVSCTIPIDNIVLVDFIGDIFDGWERMPTVFISRWNEARRLPEFSHWRAELIPADGNSWERFFPDHDARRPLFPARLRREFPSG